MTSASTPAPTVAPSTRWTWMVAVPLVPAIASLASAHAQGWVPMSDTAVAAIRAVDVSRGHLSSLGLPASISEFTSGPQRYHPGPLMFWALAPFTWVFGTQVGTAVGAVAVNTAAAVGAIAASTRGSKPRLTYGVTIAVLVTGATVWGPGHLYDPFNTMFPALAFLCLLVLAWRLACGDAAMLPWAVLVASFCVQTHVVYALPSVSVLLPATAILLGPPRWRPAGRPRPRLRLLAGSAALGALLWIGPIVEAARHGGGNLLELTKGTEGAQVLGFHGASSALLRLVDLPPAPLTAVSDSSFLRGTNVSLLVLLAAAVWLTRHAWRTGDTELRRLTSIAVAACLGAAVTTALLPDSGLEGAQMTFFKVVWVFFWMALLVPWAQTWPIRAPRRGLVRGLAFAVLGAITLVSCLPFQIRNGYDPDGWLYDAEPQLEQQLVQALPADRPVRIEAAGGRRYLLLMYGLVAALDASGREVGVTDDRRSNYGDDRVMADQSGLVTLHVQDPSMTPPEGATLVARFRPVVDQRARRRLEADLLTRAKHHGVVKLTPEGTNQLDAALLGRPGISDAEIEDLRRDPSGLLDLSPELLAVLYRNDWIAEPSLPGDVWADYVRLLGPAAVDIWATTGA